MAVVRAFNSLKSFERLKSSGVSEEQARIFVDIFEQVTTSSVEHLASKEDLENTEVSLKQDIRNTETTLKQDIRNTETTLKQDIRNTEMVLRKDMEIIVAKTRTELKEDITAVKHELKEDNAAIKAEMSTLKKVGFLVFGTILINIIISLMHTHT